MPARGIIEVLLNVSLDILVIKLTNNPMHKTKHMILSASGDSMAKDIDLKEVDT